MKIVIDPGHGGHDPGAGGRDMGLTEADVNLAVGILFRDVCADRGHTVTMTRSTAARLVDSNRSRDLEARGDLANRVGADCLISLHCNSAENRTASGFEVFSYPGSGKGKALAVAVADAWRTVFFAQKFRGTKEADFAVLRRPRMPAVLVETEFISHAAGERWLSLEENRRQMAAALADGVEAWGRSAGLW